VADHKEKLSLLNRSIDDGYPFTSFVSTQRSMINRKSTHTAEPGRRVKFNQSDARPIELTQSVMETKYPERVKEVDLWE
jgi:hypothetical protein